MRAVTYPIAFSEIAHDRAALARILSAWQASAGNGRAQLRDAARIIINEINMGNAK